MAIDAITDIAGNRKKLFKIFFLLRVDVSLFREKSFYFFSMIAKI